MKNILFWSTLLLFLSFSENSYSKPWYKSIKWPKDRVQDEVQLLPLGFEIKLNFFLEKLRESLGVAPSLHLVQSLQGQDMDVRARELIQESQDGGETLIFFLSLSDRQFKIFPHPALEGKINETTLDHLVRVTVPSFRKQSYPLGIQIFLQNLVYELDAQSGLTVPNLTEKKGKNLNNLLFFLSCTLIILILGHKFRLTKGILHKSKDLTKGKTQSMGVFW